MYIKNKVRPGPLYDQDRFSDDVCQFDIFRQLKLRSGYYIKKEKRMYPLLKWPFNETIRDAMAVSRALSIRYLWVDRLCIQDDQDSPNS
jgi:hypothetical protein